MNPENIGSRKERALETRKLLYTTAHKLFAQYGFDGVSVDKIVEEAGLSKGTFYVHYASKDALMASLISDHVEKVDTDYQSYIDTFSPDAPAASVLVSLVEKISDVIVSEIGLQKMKVLYKMLLANNSHSLAVTSYNRTLYKTITIILERGVRKGEFRTTLSLELLAHQIILALRGLTYEWCIRYPDFDLKVQSRAHFEIILKGIMADNR